MSEVRGEGEVGPELMRRALLAEQPLLSTAGVAALLMPVFAFGLGWAGIAVALGVAGTALAVGVHQSVKRAVGTGVALAHRVTADALHTTGPGFDDALAWKDARGWYPVEGGTVVAAKDGSVRALPDVSEALRAALASALGPAAPSRTRSERLPALAALLVGAGLAAAVILGL
ncbi:MAG: hypothetical protein AAGH15_16405 [Myxococcota bacterium]